MRLFDSFGGKTVVAAQTKSAQTRRASGLSYQYGRPYVPPTAIGSDVVRLVRDTFERITWIFRSVDAIASDAAALPIVVRDGDPTTGEAIENHELLPLLNWKASPEEFAFAFRYRVVSQLLLSTRGVFIEHERSRGGELLALRLLPPQYTKPIPDPHAFVKGFEVRIGGTVEQVDADRVTWIRLPHPLDPYRSMTPIEAMGITIDTEWLAKLYNANFLRNDGRPGGMVAVKGKLMAQDAEEIKARFSGPQRAGQWTVVEADGLDVEDMAINPREGQYAELRKMSKDELLIGMGTPESVLGNASGRTFDNADAEVGIYWEQTMPKYLRVVGNALDELDGDPTTYVVHDTSGVSALQRIEERRRDQLLAELDAGVITPDEYREATHRPTTGLPDMQRHYIGLGRVPIDATSREITPAKSAEVEQSTEPAASRRPFAESKAATVERAANQRLLTHYEGVMADTMRRFFARQQRVVLQRLSGPKARQGTRHDERAPSTKAIDVDRLFDTTGWDRQLVDELSDVLSSMYQGVGDDVLVRLLGSEAGSFAVSNPLVTQALNGRVTKIAGINTTTAAELRRALQTGEAAGESISQLAARVRGVFGRASTLRARTIARTEVVGAVNDAAWLAAGQSGVVTHKTWLALHDDRTRDAHVLLDEQEQLLDDPFEVGGVEIMYPGDYRAPAAMTINCRCTLTFRTADDDD